jgi:hypothetical protein
VGEVDTAGWERCVVPGAGPTFRYPATTPEGAPVVLDDVHVHLQSRGTNEVYAEVSQHVGTTAAEQYERERAFAVERLGAGVEPFEETTFAGRPAWTYAFAWEGKRRGFVVVEDGDRLYRIVVTPSRRSPAPSRNRSSFRARSS